MKRKDAKTDYIDTAGIPHGDWRRIIGANLAKWNAERDDENDITNNIINGKGGIL